MNLLAKLGLDTKAFEAGLKRMKDKTNAFMAQQSNRMGSGAAGGFQRGGFIGGLAGIPIVGGIIRGLMTGPMEQGAKIRDEATKMGVAAETFQHLDYAARQSGASIENVGQAFKALSMKQQDAVNGSKEAAGAFERYGITVDQLKAKSPQDLFALIAKQVENGVNKANELADLQRILGESGTQLLPTMQAGLGRAVQESMRIGAPMTEQQVRDYAAANDQLTKLNQQLSAARYALVNYGAESLANFAMDTALHAPGMNYGEATTLRLQRELIESRQEQINALNAIKANTDPLKR